MFFIYVDKYNFNCYGITKDMLLDSDYCNVTGLTVALVKISFSNYSINTIHSF